MSYIRRYEIESASPTSVLEANLKKRLTCQAFAEHDGEDLFDSGEFKILYTESKVIAPEVRGFFGRQLNPPRIQSDLVVHGSQEHLKRLEDAVYLDGHVLLSARPVSHVTYGFEMKDGYILGNKDLNEALERMFENELERLRSHFDTETPRKFTGSVSGEIAPVLRIRRFLQQKASHYELKYTNETLDFS
ncbi:MAG TPA: hypothetical protein VJB66_02920, partial [Candidatus Nanoarchaeia archaeon]|nr:hypothetical protein [Candidatus Nanoarchaeia archaeon]